MKGIVFIWSQLNFFPALTPFLLFPALRILRGFLQHYLEPINSVFRAFMLLSFLVMGTYWMLKVSPDRYARYLAERGLEIDATVQVVVHSSSSLRGGEYDKVVIGYQDSEGTPLRASYVSTPRRFYPIIQEPIALPAVGEKLRIRYFPTVEMGLIILTDGKKSTYGAKLECNQATLNLHDAEVRYLHDAFPTNRDIDDLRKSIDFILQGDCLDPKERERVRDLKERDRMRDLKVKLQ